MKRLLLSIIFATAGYTAGAIGGYYLTTLLSDNRHDLAIEAATTGGLITGPLIGFITFIVALIISRK